MTQGASACEPRIVRASNPGPMTLDGTRSYVLAGDPTVMIDPGPRDASHLASLAEAVGGRDVAWVLLTHAHADHAGNAAAACEHFGAGLAASRRTLGRLDRESRGDGSVRTLEDGEPIELSGRIALTVLHAPGHSADHVCYLELPSRHLYSGDLVLGEGSSAILHPDGSVAACLASLARLLALRPTRLYPGHGPPVETAAARLEEYRRHRLERERQIEAALAAGASSVPDVREAVYGRLAEGLVPAAEASVAAHLAALADRGRSVPPFDGFASFERGTEPGPG